MARVEFFFDLSSPWTYLGFLNMQRLAARRAVDVRWRPILVGGVFNAVNPTVYAARENADSPKYRHAATVLHEWAAWTGVKLRFPTEHHPVRSVEAMRMACALEDDQERLARFARAAFDAYFLRGENLDDPAVLVAAADAAGLDGAAIRAASLTDAVKTRLRAGTEELVRRGGYGSPTIFVDRERMFFGNDQLPLVEAALGAARTGGNTEIVNRFIASWGDGDLAATMRYFAPDAIYHNIPMPVLQGHDAIARFIGSFFERVQDGTLSFAVLHSAEGGDGAVLNERLDEFTLKDGRRIRIPVMGVFELRDGRITAWRDYFDMKEYEAQLRA